MISNFFEREVCTRTVLSGEGFLKLAIPGKSLGTLVDKLSPLTRRFIRVAPDGAVAPNSGPAFKTWNQFQSGTAGQFASRAEAAAAWNAYKQANGILTGTLRSGTARGNFLNGLAEDVNTPSWMKQWLSQGKTPPGYDVDHILPLSAGGLDEAANMRLQLRELHRLHHQFYRPWE